MQNSVIKFINKANVLTIFVWMTVFVLFSNHFDVNKRISQESETDWRTRIELIKNTCKVTPLHLKKQLFQSSSSYNSELMMNMVHIPLLNMNWCLVPKVASSSISSAILPFLPQQNLTMQWTTVHDKVWQRAGHVGLNDYLSSNKSSSFLVTRHPFTRIASAFRNKLENRTRSHDGDYFYNNYSKKIFKLTRGIWSKDKSEPKFSEFVKYLLKTNIQQYDEHWQPIGLRCRVCQLSYTHILHYESLAKEWPQYISDIGISEQIGLPWQNKGDGEDLKKYFEKISEEDKLQLFHKFVTDFTMFGYNLHDDL